MHHICGERPLLGTLLLEQNAVREDDLELALRARPQNGERLGEILVELELLCRPALDRAVASQSGVELEEERGSARVCGPSWNAGTAVGEVFRPSARQPRRRCL